MNQKSSALNSANMSQKALTLNNDFGLARQLQSRAVTEAWGPRENEKT